MGKAKFIYFEFILTRFENISLILSSTMFFSQLVAIIQAQTALLSRTPLVPLHSGQKQETDPFLDLYQHQYV